MVAIVESGLFSSNVFKKVAFLCIMGLTNCSRSVFWNCASSQCRLFTPLLVSQDPTVSHRAQFWFKPHNSSWRIASYILSNPYAGIKRSDAFSILKWKCSSKSFLCHNRSSATLWNKVLLQGLRPSSNLQGWKMRPTQESQKLQFPQKPLKVLS